MADQNQQLSKPASKKDVRELLQQHSGELARALPRHLTPDRFTRIALTAINKNPRLLQCTQESLFACMLDCAAAGLEPDGRRAHLIPFEDRRNNKLVCTLIFDYKGIAEMVRRSGLVRAIHCDVVYEKDDFDYEYGSKAFLAHRPALKDRGAKIAAYSHVALTDGGDDFMVMSIEEVDKVRASSRAKDSGPWVTFYDEMAKKTAFRRHSKTLPLSPELREQIEKDDEDKLDDPAETARPVSGTEIRFGETEIASDDQIPGLEQPPAEEPEAEKKPRKTKTPPPPPDNRSPLEKLTHLLAGARIVPTVFVRYMVENRELEPSDVDLAKLSDEKINRLIEIFPDHMEKIDREF